MGFGQGSFVLRGGIWVMFTCLSPLCSLFLEALFWKTVTYSMKSTCECSLLHQTLLSGPVRYLFPDFPAILGTHCPPYSVPPYRATGIFPVSLLQWARTSSQRVGQCLLKFVSLRQVGAQTLTLSKCSLNIWWKNSLSTYIYKILCINEHYIVYIMNKMCIIYKYAWEDWHIKPFGVQ